MDYPKISIVTPVINQVEYVEDTIQSILSQGYPNLEYIIIDGGSTDGTIDIIKKYESKLAYWISEPDHSMYDALQKGFNKSTGEIMGWLNADDVLIKKALSIIGAIFQQHTEINWLTGANTQMNENGEIVGNNPALPFHKYSFLMHDYMWIAQESTYWRRNLYEQAGNRMATELKYAGDFELWLRFFHYDQLFRVAAPIGIYRICKGQLSSDIDKYIAEVDHVYSLLTLSDEETNIINKYKTRVKMASLINKTKIFNGNKIMKLRSFEKKYFPVPSPLVYNSHNNNFCYSDVLLMR